MTFLDSDGGGYGEQQSAGVVMSPSRERLYFHARAWPLPRQMAMAIRGVRDVLMLRGQVLLTAFLWVVEDDGGREGWVRLGTRLWLLPAHFWTVREAGAQGLRA